MVKSMTGFGKSEVTLPNRKITVEIRSLNSKQMDLSLRLPAIYRQSEYEIRNAVARALRRGKVDVFVSVESQAVETSAHINGQVLAAYAGELREAAREALVRGIRSFRIDTHPDNGPMRALLVREGFACRGKVRYEAVRLAYEKPILG